VPNANDAAAAERSENRNETAADEEEATGP